VTFNWDPLGKVLLEVRSDSGVTAIAGANPTASPARVRGFEPAPSDIGAGNSTSPYKAFVVLVNLGARRERRVPVQRPRILARCYGRTPAEAAQLAAAVSDAVHFKGPRVASNDLGIYASFDDTSGEQDRDPDTLQPYVTVFMDVVATTQAVA
jgi:hypothetical protein